VEAGAEDEARLALEVFVEELEEILTTGLEETVAVLQLPNLD
jgi:hypothetical protein